MKKHLLATTAAGAALAITSPAMAGGYVSIFGGYSMNDQEASARIAQASGSSSFNTTATGSLVFNSSHVHYTSSGFTGVTAITGVSGTHFWSTFDKTISHSDSAWISATDVDLKASDGFVVGAAFGKEIATGLRGEIELSYRKQDVDAKGTSYFSSGFNTTTTVISYTRGYFHAFYVTASATVDGSAVTTSDIFGTTTKQIGSTVSSTGGGSFTSSAVKESGDISAMSIMANVWLDVDLGLGDNVHPYIGAGVGYADVKLDVGSVDISDNGVAFQVGAGVSFDMPTEGHALSFEVRRFVVPKLELTYNGWDVPLDYETTDIIVKYTIQL